MSKKLLLADDSITIQKVIQITFAHEDYDLTITDNGDAALAKAQEIKPDLVMADVYMPGKNGYELTTAIKQDPALQNTPVLLLAGSFEPFDEEKARSCQADAWIEKPFESQSLIDKVAELLNAAPTAASESQQVVEAAPVAAAEPVSETASLVDFGQPVTEEPEVAAVPEDSFGDISFAEETPAAAPEPIAAADDWSDVAAESEVVTPAVEETFAAAEKPVIDDADDFTFAEDEPVAAAASTSLDEDVDLDAFDMAEEEIMPLDEDDILGEEDLEPAPPEQTLAAWSRDSAPDEEIFAAEETVFVEEQAVAEAEPEVQDTPVFEAPVADIAPVVAEPVAESTPLAASSTAEREPEFVTVATAMADVEEKASALSEDEIEQVIEKVVTKVVEKLAGTILERVAWEVVPDLAEHLIREEIRKIKEAAA